MMMLKTSSATFLDVALLLLSVLLVVHNVAARRSNRAPRITTLKSPNYFVVVGTTAVLPCRAKGRPKPSVRWYRDGQPVESISKDYSQNNDNKALRIFHSRLGDAGNYTCVAENRNGRASKTFYLPIVQYPKVTVTPHAPILVKEGDHLDISCQAFAFPTPYYSWITSRDLRLNSVTMTTDTDSTRYKVRDHVIDMTHSKSVLSISPVTHQDYGLFVCFSGNKGESTRQDIMLDVQFAPKAVDVEAGERKIVHYHQADSGPAFSLSCAATGNELPTIQWFYNDKPLNTSHCPLVRNPPEIRSFACTVTENKMGLYACYAENKYGRVLIQEFDVAPLYPPPPLSIYVDRTHANRVTLTAPLGIANTPDPDYVLISYCLLVAGKPSPRRRDVYETTADLDSEGETTVFLPGLKEHSSYLVTVASKNQVGLGPEVTAIITTGTLVSLVDDLVRLSGISGDVQLLETPSGVDPGADTPYSLAEGDMGDGEDSTAHLDGGETDDTGHPATIIEDDGDKNSTGVRSDDVDDDDDNSDEKDDKDRSYREATAYSVLGKGGASHNRMCSVEVLILVASLVSVKVLVEKVFL